MESCRCRSLRLPAAQLATAKKPRLGLASEAARPASCHHLNRHPTKDAVDAPSCDLALPRLVTAVTFSTCLLTCKGGKHRTGFLLLRQRRQYLAFILWALLLKTVEFMLYPAFLHPEFLRAISWPRNI